jgi:uncharacterized membrane protein YhaH (DUF805 family)
MQGSLEEPPIIVRGRRWSWQRIAPAIVFPILLLSRFSVYGGSASAMAQDPMNWMFAGVGGLMVIALVVMVVSPPTLELSPQGIRRTYGWRTWRYRWDDVVNFRPVHLSRLEAVGFDYTDPAKAASRYRQWVRVSYGAPGVLASNMELPAVELVGLLNRARAKWADTAVPVATREARPGLVPFLLGKAVAAMVGRTSRRAYWTGLAVVAAIAAVVALVPGGGVMGALVALIGWLTLARGRMRDIGRSPLWLNAIWGPVGLALLLPLTLGAGPYVAGAVAAMVMLGIVGWLGAPSGDPGRNRFGPPPGGPSETEVAESAFT